MKIFLNWKRQEHKHCNESEINNKNNIFKRVSNRCYSEKLQNTSMNMIRVSLAWIESSWLAPTVSNTLSHRFVFVFFSFACISTDSNFFHSSFVVFVFVSLFVFNYEYLWQISIAHKFTSNYSKLTLPCLGIIFALPFVAILSCNLHSNNTRSVSVANEMTTENEYQYAQQKQRQQQNQKS